MNKFASIHRRHTESGQSARQIDGFSCATNDFLMSEKYLMPITMPVDAPHMSCQCKSILENTQIMNIDQMNTSALYCNLKKFTSNCAEHFTLSYAMRTKNARISENFPHNTPQLWTNIERALKTILAIEKSPFPLSEC